jgi:hypothetical protein
MLSPLVVGCLQGVHEEALEIEYLAPEGSRTLATTCLIC